MLPSGNTLLDQSIPNSYYTVIIPYGFTNSTTRKADLHLNMVNASFSYNWFFGGLQQSANTFYETAEISPFVDWPLDEKFLFYV